MKVRWTRDSVRLRITPSELEALQRGEVVEEELRLGGGGWIARIYPGAETTELMFARADLQIALSAADGERLAAPDAEGVYFQQEEEPAVRYLIEKDFPCVHPRPSEAQEPQTETFMPAAGFTARKGVDAE